MHLNPRAIRKLSIITIAMIPQSCWLVNRPKVITNPLIVALSLNKSENLAGLVDAVSLTCICICDSVHSAATLFPAFNHFKALE